MQPDLEPFVPFPKVLLHDHLDGGLRPRTVIELAAEQGYAGLPTTDEAALRSRGFGKSGCLGIPLGGAPQLCTRGTRDGNRPRAA